MRTYSRRDVLKRACLTASAAIGAGLTRLPVLHAAGPAHEKLGVAVIGCGGQGKRLPLWTARSHRLVAMVDIDEKAIAAALENIKDTDAKPKIYYDYRRMLDECHKDLNVALIAAPDHHHAPAAVRAMERGLHIFCEKPLAHNIRECRILGEVAKKNRVFTAMGNQGHYGEGHHRLCEYIWAGAIGDVTEAHCVVDDSFGGYGGGSLTNDFTTTSGRLTEWILTGHLAAFAGVGGKLEWDVQKRECANEPGINQYIGRTYRKGWEV